MKVRRLSVLDINDRDAPSFRAGTGIARHFDVRRLRTWMHVQQDVGSGQTSRPDIVLVDIDFEDDPSVRDVDFGCGGAKPLGLLLALPYVASRAVWTFTIYSAHFIGKATSGVMQSPWVLLPFGILFAKLEGRVFGSSVMNQERAPTGETIERRMARLPRVGNPAEALQQALSLHNDRLIGAVEDRRVRVTNGRQLHRALEALVDQCHAAGQQDQAVDPGLYLELYSENYGIDRIQWLSLCAKHVDYDGDRVGIEAANDMLAFADSLCGSDPVFQMVVEVIRLQNEREEKDSRARRPRFDIVASELYGGQSEEERRQILRIGVLLANAHAWAKSNFSLRRNEDVFQRLGITNGSNTYVGWFGERSRSKKKRHKVCTRSLRVDRLDKFEDSASKTLSCYVEWSATELSTEDKARVLHFLEAFEEEEGYQLPPGGFPYLVRDEPVVDFS